MLSPVYGASFCNAESYPNADRIKELADSMKEIGLLNPITVRRTVIRDRGISSDGFQVVSGKHRLEAAILLGWKEIEANIVELDDLRAELAMIDENIIRQEIKGALRERALRRRKAIYEALHPETRAGVAGAIASNKAQGNATPEIWRCVRLLRP